MDTSVKKVIAIDFDGTITGKIRLDAVKVIKKLQTVYTCVLWTCRKNGDLLEAINLLKSNGIEFDYVNRSPYPERGSNKIYADVYIDDKNINTIIDWNEIEKTLLGSN